MSYGGGYGRRSGDPFLGGLVKGVLGIGSMLPGVGGIASKARGVLFPSTVRPAFGGGMPMMPGGSVPGGGKIVKVPGIKGVGQRIVPGGATGYQIEGQRRRRINPTNPKALRRAIRRTDSFVKLAKSALKNTGWTVVSKASRRPKADLGRGHRHIR